MNRGARAEQGEEKAARMPPTAHEDGVEGADRKSARGTLQLPPAAKTSNFQYNPPQQNNMQQQNNWELNREVRAAQGRGRACRSEQCTGFTSVLIKEKRLQTFFQLRTFGGRRPPTARGDGVERADRMSARGTLQLPPAAEC